MAVGSENASTWARMTVMSAIGRFQYADSLVIWTAYGVSLVLTNDDRHHIL